MNSALKDIVDTFRLQDVIPWCVLAHIDVQAEVSESYPGTVATMFQSLAGTDDCNKIFDITNEKILKYAKSKKGERYGLYFETGQGSEFTNGAANGVDMMVLEVPKVWLQQGGRSRNSQRCSRGARGSMSTMLPGSLGRRSSRAANSWCGAASKTSSWASSMG